MEINFLQKMEEWKEEKKNLCERISRVEERAASQEATIQTLQSELLAAKSGRLEEGEIQPSMMEELNTMREEIRVIREKKSWATVISATQKKVEEAEKWIEVTKKGKGKEAPCTPTLINMTLEEEQRRRMRSLHVRVTGLKDINNVEKEVTILTYMMGEEKPSHTKAWRVGKKRDDPGESSKERALILRFPSLEEKKKFLKKRPTLKKTGIYLGDDLTLSQLAHMREVMPEIIAAREKGKNSLLQRWSGGDCRAALYMTV